MGPKSAKDSESPSVSASASILPQLRASRRGSFASFTSNAQLDKDTLSQALDQIHSTASQSGTLTTFNEYTSPPSSSSGTDSKGIASELHGGLSGLYTRFRASVGNVKDIVNPGGEEAAGDATSVKTPEGATQSPAPSNKSTSGSQRPANLSSVNVPSSGAPTSERHSPMSAKSPDPFQYERTRSSKSSRTSLGSANASSKSLTGSTVTLKSPPATLTQTSMPIAISPALAEVNISASKRLGHSDTRSSDITNSGLSLSQEAGRNMSAKRSQISPAEEEAADMPGSVLPEIRIPEGAGNGNTETGTSQTHERLGHVAVEKLSGDRGGEQSHRQVSEDTIQQPLILEEEEEDNEDPDLTDDVEENNAPAATNQMDMSPLDDSMQSFDRRNGKEVIGEVDKKAKYQHLELPLRKGLAPPLITRSHSPNSSISRASSSDITLDGLLDSPLRQRSHVNSNKRANSSPMKGRTPRPTVENRIFHHDQKTVDVFSQAKNKVLSKQYWMKDENARDCFYCGDPFSTFRRKHHCSKSIGLELVKAN